METREFKLIATDFLAKGTKYHRERNLTEARKCYSICYGLYRYLEKGKHIGLCVNLLASTKIDREYLLELEKWGCDAVL